MRIIVNDSSALIDLKKGGLLEVLVELPFEFVVSDALLADELLSFSRHETAFMRRKMTVATLDGSEMLRVAALQAASPNLSFHDCSSLIIAQRESGCILLTGDRRLRTRAEAAQVECHGVLWIVEELAKAKLALPKTLLKALETWREDSTVRLPSGELSQAISRFKR
jgi:predicted nucleic acid-binding protein